MKVLLRKLFFKRRFFNKFSKFFDFYSIVGIDVGSHIAIDLAKAFGERFAGGNIGVMEDFVKAGFMGRKSGKGLFVYEGNSKNRELNQGALEILKQKYQLTPKGADSIEDIQLRLVSR